MKARQINTASRSRKRTMKAGPVGKLRYTHLHTHARSGRSDGYAKGWNDGYRLGASHAIARTIPVPDVPKRQLKVMFVRENSTGYHLIESGIITALSKAVSEVMTATTLDPIAEIAERERPDLVLVLNGIFVLQPETLERIRSLGIRTAAWFADDPYFMELSTRLVPHYDHIFTHEAGVVNYYNSLGGKVSYLPFAAPVELAAPTQVDHSYWTDVCLIGSGFPNRIAFIDRIAPYLKDKRVFIAGGLWNQLKAYGSLRSSIHLHGVPVNEALNYYNGAKIVLNLHRNHELGAYAPHVSMMSVNPRTFEMNACATLQLTDVRADLTTLYTPGVTIETYRNAEECVEKIRYYLSRDGERMELALRGYEETRRSHTYEHRIMAILQTIYGAS